MNLYRIIGGALLCFCGLSSPAQTLTHEQIAVGNGSNQLAGSPALKYSDDGILTLTALTENYIKFVSSSAGVGYQQMDPSGHFFWWTPMNGTAKMKLTNEGQLRIGMPVFDIAPDQSQISKYSLIAARGGRFFDQVKIVKDMPGSYVDAPSTYHNTSDNTYNLKGTTVGSYYHNAQSNVFRVSSNVSGQNDVMSGYQSSAQSNTVELNNQNYSDLGAGQVWSVQTNYFNPNASNVSKYINTYIRTQLGLNNTIGSYYSLFLEAPFGQGTTAQIGNYYGVYQESAAARNFFEGKVAIGTQPASASTAAEAKLAVNGKVWVGDFTTGASVNNDALLAVNGRISCSRLKVTQAGWADFVFHPNYRLLPLSEVEAFIKAQGHLPGVITAAEVEEKGADVGDTQKMLLQKVEELTLYLIDLKKEMNHLQQDVQQLKKSKND